MICRVGTNCGVAECMVRGTPGPQIEPSAGPSRSREGPQEGFFAGDEPLFLLLEPMEMVRTHLPGARREAPALFPRLRRWARRPALWACAGLFLAGAVLAKEPAPAGSPARPPARTPAQPAADDH